MCRDFSIGCTAMRSTVGSITIPAGCDIWPHEMKTARALAEAGYDVAFVRCVSGDKVKTPDVQMDGVLWEMKCPETNQLKSLQRVLRRASQQSPNVLIDSARMKGVGDQAVERELRRLKPLVRAVRRLILVNKERDVIDLN